MRRLIAACVALLVLAPLTTSAQAELDCSTQVCLYIPGVYAQRLPSIIRNSDFELGNNGDWALSSSAGRQPITTEHPLIPAHSGQWVVRMGGHLNETTKITQAVSVPSVPAGYGLDLHYWFFTDGPPPECSTDALDEATVGVVVGAERWENGHSLCKRGETPAWIEGRVAIEQYSGQVAIIVIETTTIGDFAGEFYLDDLSFRLYCADPSGCPPKS